MIYIVRHGETVLNSRRVLQGRSDYSLNDQGKKQAEETAKWFRDRGIVLDRVYSSPLKRACETARIIAPEAPIILEPLLMEMDYGPYEGMSLDAPAPEVMAFFRDFSGHPAPDGMEALSSVVERAGRFMETLRGCRETLLISTHAIAMKGILEYLTPDAHGRYWSTYIGNCEVYATQPEKDGFQVPYPLPAKK